MAKSNRVTQSNEGFTGLEAAIVLIAFVVVAAVFSYVMLGAGFFTSQKSKEVVHTGVDQATSSIELAGDIIGVGDPVTQNLTAVKITVQLTAGNNPVDINKTIISYRTTNTYNASVFDGSNPDEVQWITTVNEGTPNNLLEKYEKVQLTIPIIAAEQVGPNQKIVLEVKPPTGAILAIQGTTPAAIDPVMVLY
ncbi:putative archaeal flagellin [Methanocella conradii HZ254]|uniref:Flagellin n=1 Tax=Methanocella conradii (strain DSM 24694 / JCM 17849 / CGMCC 1.5162 / HZ254) TaxID=1041930 RepID=H8I4S3_METCZ|nr:archaellin/type IV pilin N-terminal domain-containing protein [Methanocella conradii]AFD00668.1 putative archaeal flagellin [Methanocella conradii HZ254]MDI6896366.1 flagellin [Methanocella conradii]